MVLPKSTATVYTNLLSSANSSFPMASPAALHMALLMQSQQLRALTAAVTAGQNNAAASGTGSSTPTPPSSGISTVLATPLPPSLSSTSSSLQTRTSPTTGSGTKRESSSSTSSSKYLNCLLEDQLVMNEDLTITRCRLDLIKTAL